MDYPKVNPEICTGCGNCVESCPDELGFIFFGSRVDVYLPCDAYIAVKMNERVKGNLSVLARII